MAFPSPRQMKKKGLQSQYCYFEGYLEKKSPEDKDYIKYWAVLRENTIFFHNNGRNVEYMEKLDLDTFQSIADDPTKDKKQKNARMSLKLQNTTVKLQVASFETKELWKGFILAVTRLEVPTDLALLPGQIHRLTEVVNEEKERLGKKMPPKCTESSNNNTSLPPCYHRVSRLEAEVLLEKYKDRGNMIMRPASDNKNVSISTLQMVKCNAEYKHYKINSITNGYIIDIEPQVFCKTLHEVVDYFVLNTNGALVPLASLYENKIDVTTNKKTSTLPNKHAQENRISHSKEPETGSLKCLNDKDVTTNKKTSTPPNKHAQENRISHFKASETGEYLNDEEIGTMTAPVVYELEPEPLSDAQVTEGNEYWNDKESQPPSLKKKDTEKTARKTILDDVKLTAPYKKTPGSLKGKEGLSSNSFCNEDNDGLRNELKMIFKNRQKAVEN